MKDLFPSYYGHTDVEIDQLWEGAVFIVDANVLLQLYDLPQATRDQTLEAFKALENRMWIPHQAAVEYQRNRLRSIGNAQSSTRKKLQPISEGLAKFELAAAAMEFEKRGLVEAQDDLALLLELGRKVVSAAEKAVASHVPLSGIDPIRIAIGEIFAGRIGEAPTQEDLTKWNGEAKTRYQHKRGPGWADDGKKDSLCMVGDISYERKYGDYVFWRQSLNFLSASPATRDAIVLTLDSKPDWWAKYNDEVVAPHPELHAEMIRHGDLDRFWMYDLESFLKEARARLGAAVSETTLNDVARSVQDVEFYMDGELAAADSARRDGAYFAGILAHLNYTIIDKKPHYASGVSPNLLVPGGKQEWAISVGSESIDLDDAAIGFQRIAREIAADDVPHMNLYIDVLGGAATRVGRVAGKFARRLVKMDQRIGIGLTIYEVRGVKSAAVVWLQI